MVKKIMVINGEPMEYQNLNQKNEITVIILCALS